MSASIESVYQVIENAKLGISVSELMDFFPSSSKRTMQRHIAKLIETNRIQAQGNARARRYFAIYSNQKQMQRFSTQKSINFPENIPLSADSKDILNYIEQPPSARHPVGYQLEFLDSYEPNKTYYLPEPTRRHLHKIGKTPNLQAPAGTYSRAILNRLLIDLSWASSHLEGNTYSRLDTRELIEQGRVAQGKDFFETQMIMNHKVAIEFIVDNIDTVGFNAYTLMNLHSVLSENLLQNPSDEGRIRRHAVDIGLSVYRPLSTPQQIEEIFSSILCKVNLIHDPFEQSFFIMVHLPYLQPFADINKRTSRIIANLPLFQHNLCPLTFLDVPEEAYSRAVLGVYEMTRVELLRDLYVWAYERSTQEYISIKQNLAEPDPLRLIWRSFIKETVQHIVLNPELEPLSYIEKQVATEVDTHDRSNVEALIIDELRRIHEGVLARYGLRPSQFLKWKAVHMP